MARSHRSLLMSYKTRQPRDEENERRYFLCRRDQA